MKTLALIICGIFIGCSCSNGTNTPIYLDLLYGKEARIAKQRFATLTAALDTAPHLAEIKRHFPNAALNYRYFTTNYEPGINIEAVVNDRYSLTVQMPVSFAADNKSITSLGDPKFYLLEITHIQQLDGTLRALQYGQNFEFGVKEWQQIVDAGGDFSAAGIKLRSDPVDGIEIVKVEINKSMSQSNARITSDWKPSPDGSSKELLGGDSEIEDGNAD